MVSLDQVKDAIKELIAIDDVGDHVCFFGGSIPYIVANKQSRREHSDIDVLVDENYMDKIRKIAQERFHYMPNLDSVTLGLDSDYGFKIFIGDVYVEFEPIAIKEGRFVQRSFSPNSKKAGEQQIPFVDIEDLITPIKINGISTHCQSLEMIRASKEQYGRPKDIEDIEFIDNYGINQEKYERVKTALSNSISNIFEYEDFIM